MALPMTINMRLAVAGVAWAILASHGAAHEHHTDDIPEGHVISPEPLDTILWLHILVQTTAWGVVFPLGMVLGISRSRWHVPVQVFGTALAIVGYFLGHAHKGRQFTSNIHSAFATPLSLMLASQILLGIYLRLHLEKGIQGRVRRYVVMLHGIVGKVLPVASWVQMLFGGITALGYCREDHLGQCLAHFIMGSAFIGYGIILTILLLAGQLWLRRTGRSQEFFDSLIITLWGCVNTFTEHRWGQPWGGNDLQHTSMGIVWWCAGLLGMWLSRSRDGRPRRNLMPALVIILTGWAMGGHPQSLHISTMVHTTFGYTLMAAGGARIIEIAFLLKDKSTISDRHWEETNSFQYLTPFLLYASGFLFMGATEEQMALLDSLHVTHVSYILLLFSVSFILYLFVIMLLHVYVQHAWPLDPASRVAKSTSHREAASLTQRSKRRSSAGRTNGHAIPPSNHLLSPDTPDGETLEPYADATPTSARAPSGLGGVHVGARDAEEFELEGLMSDDTETGDVEAVSHGRRDSRK